MKASLVNGLRKGIDVLLKVDSQDIVLIPHKRIQKQGGVYDLEPQPPRDPQPFNIEPSVATTTVDAAGGVGQSDSGANAHLWTFVLTGRHDAQIEIGDTWKNGETEYRVVTIQPRNNYSTIAIVSAVGKDPAYGT